MPKTVDAALSHLTFPATCVVCMSPASKQYRLERTFTFGRRSQTIHVDVPMCGPHFEMASFKGPAERLVGILGVIIGILMALSVAIMLLLHWHRTGEGNILLNLFASIALGLGISLILWVIISLSVAPLFAEPGSREARKAVQITHYWPSGQLVRLRFENEQLAEIVQRLN